MIGETRADPVQEDRTERLAVGCRPAFGGHRGYPPEYGQLSLVHECLSEDEFAFIRDDAAIRFRTSQDKRRALRYWSRAFKLAEESNGADKNAGRMVPTARARWLFGSPGKPGADPWLEDEDSLWLLHWWLLEPPSLAPAWWIAICGRSRTRLGPAELRNRIITEAARAGWDIPSDATVRRDVSCFISMYRPGADGESLEDSLRHQFRTLGVLTPGTSQEFPWRITGTFARAPEITAYACLDYAARRGMGKSVVLSRLATDPGGPGSVLLLSEEQIAEDLKKVSSETEPLSVRETIGQRVLDLPGDPAAAAWRILGDLYGAPDTGEALHEARSLHRAPPSAAQQALFDMFCATESPVAQKSRHQRTSPGKKPSPATQRRTRA